MIYKLMFSVDPGPEIIDAFCEDAGLGGEKYS